MTDTGHDTKPETADAPPPLRRISAAKVVAGATAGSFVAGTSAGILASNVIPLKTFDWILDHGLQGFALVAIFVLLWLYLRSEKKREIAQAEKESAVAALNQKVLDCERERYDDRVAVEHELRAKYEAFLGEGHRGAQATRRSLNRLSQLIDQQLTEQGPGPTPSDPNDEAVEGGDVSS